MSGLMHRQGQRGAAVVEFALVSLLLFTLVFGVIEVGRMLWIWNAAVEATRLGARVAATCDLVALSPVNADNVVKKRMRDRLPELTASQVVVAYLPTNCSAATCQAVRVSLSGYEHQTLIPLLPLKVTLPAFPTTLRREAMSSTGNTACNV